MWIHSSNYFTYSLSLVRLFTLCTNFCWGPRYIIHLWDRKSGNLFAAPIWISNQNQVVPNLFNNILIWEGAMRGLFYRQSMEELLQPSAFASLPLNDYTLFFLNKTENICSMLKARKRVPLQDTMKMIKMCYLQPKLQQIFYEYNLVTSEAVLQGLCCICQAPRERQYLNYGVKSCLACRAFFKRSSQFRMFQLFQCSFKGQCKINPWNRSNCRKCRYEKCQKEGMKITIGKRQSQRQKSTNWRLY